MAMGGSSSKTQSMEQSHKTETENSTEAARLTPWAPVAQDMTAIAGDARNLYNSNPTGIGPMTGQALSNINAIAQQPDTAVNVGYNAIVSQLRDKRFRDRADEIYNTQSASEQNLQDVAQGKYLSGANPYMDDLIARSQRDAANQVAAKFAASGRYGSGNFAGAIADSTGRIATEAPDAGLRARTCPSDASQPAS
jgi:hypothetical protein